ncbi:MAG: quinol dehydrogenase ferredoxin subunit NapH [Alphaproteobacteria bacterium]
MSLDDPGREAIAEKGWLLAHKWLLLRRGAQLFFLGIFLVGPLTAFWLVEGNLASSRTLDLLPLTDPLLVLQSLAARHLPETTALLGAVIVLAGYLVVGGRTYCSWVCPVNVVTDAAHWLHIKLGLAKGWQPKPGTRYGMLALVLLGSAVTGTIFWEVVNPVTIVHRALVFGLAGAWLIIAAIFLFDLLVSRRGWCSHLCPVGAFYGQINRASLLKISAAKRETCDDCMDCFAVCPEPQVITPALKSKGSPVVSHWACTNCARCIDVCSKDVYRFTLRGMETRP